jgi:transcriptional regulator with XRE-family HTH domain
MARKKPDLRDIEVGRRVRALRLEKGMSQERLGDALDLTFQQVQKYEKGTNRIGAGRLQRIAEIFGVPISALFGAQAPAAKPSDSLFELVDTSAALRLLRAYSRMTNPKLKQALVALAEEAAANDRALQPRR